MLKALVATSRDKGPKLWSTLRLFDITSLHTNKIVYIEFNIDTYDFIRF